MVRLLLALTVIMSMAVCTTFACVCDEEEVHPAVETLDATNIMSVSTTLNGKLLVTGSSPGLGTKVWFEWWVGSDDSAHQNTPEQTMTQPGTFSAQVIGTMPGNTYSFRACAWDMVHSTNGDTKTFYVP